MRNDPFEGRPFLQNRQKKAPMRLYVISDLHLGGRPHHESSTSKPGSQICHAYSELTGFIDWIGNRGTSNERVELVVNGDIVDFLMEDDYGKESESAPWLPDEAAIIQKLQQIIDRTRGGGEYGPFDAMAKLLERGHFLTFILGNHDIELSLPKVRKYVEESVLRCTDNGRFRFIFDGEAYVRGNLLIEHGNRYDPWNVIDHSALRQERSMLSRGLGKQMCERLSGHFVPPPGSLMVTKVINEIKRKYRFIDLLKPEEEAVLPILLAIDPKLQYVLNAIDQFTRKAANASIGPAQPRHDGQLSAEASIRTVDIKSSLQKMLGPECADLLQVDASSNAELGTSEAWERIKELSVNASRRLSEVASLFDEGVLTGSRYSALRAGLRAWRSRLVAQTDDETLGYVNAVKELAEQGGFQCVIFGHTHLPKQLRLQTPTAKVVTYLNTGTWADTMEVPTEILEDEALSNGVFKSFLQDLKQNTLDQYIARKLCYATVTIVNDEVVSAAVYDFPSHRPLVETL